MTPVGLPVWFLSHGAPFFLYQVDHPAHQQWIKALNDIKQCKPKGIVFISAHWQAEPWDLPTEALELASKSVLMNVNTENPLLYDFEGFPQHYYDVEFHTFNTTKMQDEVSSHLREQGYHVQGMDRGLDHGVWIPLRASGERLDIPLLQISLPIPRLPLYDGIAALRLGRALRGLRKKGYAIVGSGQSVHNIRDSIRSKQGYPIDSKYVTSFAAALTEAVTHRGTGGPSKDGDPSRWIDVKALYKRADYIKAHPTSDHLLPLLVALGASEDWEDGKETFSLSEGLMGWNFYRFG